jgi:hypothetical protein
MSDTTSIIIWVGLVAFGFLIGYTLSFAKYKKMIIDVLDNLLFTEKVNKEEYNYYKEKFIKEKDTLKGIRGFIERKKDGEKPI